MLLRLRWLPLVAMLLVWRAAGAVTLYANFDPTASVPDYGAGSSSLNASCAWYTCPWVERFSAGFDFTPVVTGDAATAYLAARADWELGGGAGRLYMLRIYDTGGNQIGCGGLPYTQFPIGSDGVFQISLGATDDYWCDSGSWNPLTLQAGTEYRAYFHQYFGQVQSAAWYDSPTAALPGQAELYCSVVTGGGCSYHATWSTLPKSDFLPTLAIADAAGLGQAAAAADVGMPGVGLMLLLGGPLLLRRLARS